jgi:hypothetical protein
VSTRRRSVDPVADDKALGERFVAIDFEIAIRRRDLLDLAATISRLEAEQRRIVNRRLELNDDRRTVERLRANAAQSRGM